MNIYILNTDADNTTIEQTKLMLKLKGITANTINDIELDTNDDTTCNEYYNTKEDLTEHTCLIDLSSRMNKDTVNKLKHAFNNGHNNYDRTNSDQQYDYLVSALTSNYERNSFNEHNTYTTKFINTLITNIWNEEERYIEQNA